MDSGAPSTILLPLLADCKEHPHEEGYRLVLADWLEDNGSSLDRIRAELIRCQVEYSRLPPEEPSRNTFGRRARALIQRHQSAWLGPLGSWPVSCDFQRGLLAPLFSISTLCSRNLAAVATPEVWAWVEEIHLFQVQDAEIARLRPCSLLTGPTTLGFRGGQLGPAGLQLLGRMPWLALVIRIVLDRLPLGSQGLSALLQSPHLMRLRQLELASTHLDTAALNLLARAECSRRLERLGLHGNRLGDAGVRALCAPGTLEALTHLDLRATHVTDAGVQALAGCPAMIRLRVLELGDNQIGLAGALALAESPHLGKLESLVLWGNPVGDEGVRRLEERFGSRVHVSPGRA